MTRPLSGTDAKRLHRTWRRRTGHRVALLLDQVQTPFNVGSIVRTAAAFRVEHMWLAAANGVTPQHPKTQKTSLGTERFVPWSEVANAAAGAAEAKGAGFRVLGVELAAGARPLAEIEMGTAVCLVLGHEDRGLSPATIACCDEVGYVPTPGKVGSLNVAVAAAIALYEARRREWFSEAAGVDLDADAP